MTTRRSKKIRISFLRHFLEKKYVLVLCVVALLILVIAASVYMLWPSRGHEDTTRATNKVKAEKNDSTKTAKSAPSTTPTSADAPKDTKPIDVQEPKPKPVTATPAVETPPPVVEAAPTLPTPRIRTLQVGGFMAGTYTSCNGGAALVFSYAYIRANRSTGTIHWQIEERQEGVIHLLGEGDVLATEQGSIYEIGNLEQYRARQIANDSAIRLHATAPNDIVSAWFTPDLQPGGFGTCP